MTKKGIRNGKQTAVTSIVYDKTPFNCALTVHIITVVCFLFLVKRRRPKKEKEFIVKGICLEVSCSMT